MLIDILKSISERPLNKRKMALFSFMAIVLMTLAFSEYGIYKRLSLLSTYNSLHADMYHLKQESDSLKREIFNLRTNNREIERLAREEYGLVKKGENIIFFKSK